MECDDGFEIEPNRVAEYYRNFQPLPTPTKVEKHVEFIEICEDGNTLLGSSDLTGRFWKGSLFTYKLPADILVKKSIAGISLSSGVTDGKYLENENQLVVAEDSGTLNILGMTKMIDENASQHLVLQCKASEHDDSITSIDVFPGRTRVVTVSLDCCIKIWDCNGMVSEVTYRPAHSQGILSVSAHSNGHVFATASRDHLALLWDQRQEKPASLIMEGNVPMTAICWQTGDTPLLALGNAAGVISLIDTRQNNHVIDTNIPLRRPVFKVRFSPYNANLLAACSDDNRVVAYNYDSKHLASLYEDTRHTDYVRGLCWTHCDGLYSCGWDSKILKHQPPKPNSDQSSEMNAHETESWLCRNAMKNRTT